jgi:hypothetical protein
MLPRPRFLEIIKPLSRSVCRLDTGPNGSFQFISAPGTTLQVFVPSPPSLCRYSCDIPINSSTMIRYHAPKPGLNQRWCHADA